VLGDARSNSGNVGPDHTVPGVTAFFWAMAQALKQERAEGKDEAPFI
jgi:hypothetical protein